MRIGLFTIAFIVGLAFLSPEGEAVTKGTKGVQGGNAMEKATFAGGCFWCVESAFDKVKGVISVTSGYTGGTTANPTYEEVSSGMTGHAEAVEIVFDPSQITYEKLLDTFWRNIDPTTKDRQFCDVGRQYRTAIFYHDEKQRKLAETTKENLVRSRKLGAAVIHTEIKPASTFYPAEDYHQKFYVKNPERYNSYRLGCGRDRRLQDLWGEKTGRQGLKD